MSDLELMLLAHELLCAALFYSSFCRAVKSTERVYADVRLAFNFMGAVSCWGFVAPLMGYIPSWFGLSLLTAVVAFQWVAECLLVVHADEGQRCE